QYAIVIGETGSTWSYGHVVLSKITNGGYYSGIIDLGGTYTVYQDNAAESYTWITSDINSATNPSISTNYIQNQNTSAQAANYWINGTANSQGGYTSTSNPWGTSNSAFFPNGITTAASTNWIYGTTNYIGNAPSNGFGHQFNATSGNSSAWLAIGGGNVGVGTTSPGWKLDVTGNARIGANTAQNTLAALAVSAGQGTATTYRDIDLHGSWSANEGHAITASHASGASNIVGQIVFEHNSPGSRIKFGRLYHSGDQTTYPMELVSNGSNAILRMNNDAYDYFGPNSSWGAYLQVGGNGRVTTGASVAATNGNLHIDAADGGFATYVNYYSQNPTYINAQAGNIGLGTTATFDKVTVNGRIRFGTNDVSYTNPGAGATFGTGDPTQGIGWGNQPLDEYGIWVAPQENLYGNYTRLIIGWHTGVKIGASSSYGGTRFYNNSPVYAGSSATEIMSIGNGDNHVRVANYLFAQYVNTSDNVVGSGVSGIMVKAGDNYMRTGNAASVLSYLGVTAPTGDNLGNHTATTTLNMNGSAITNSANVYTSGWFRNTTNLNGLYNEAVGAHFYASAAHIWNMGGGGTYPQLIFRDNHQSTIRGYVYSDGSGFGLLHSSGGWAIRTQPGLQELYDDTYMNRARPYITYDRDDASYYTDLNTWSRMWGVGTFYVRNNYAESTDHPFGVYFANGMSTDYAIFRESGAWNFPYPDLRIAFHTGIKLGAHWTYGGTRFYNNSDMATLIFSVGDGDNYTRVTSNGGSDGIAMGQIHGDNTNTIQTYIDGQWANRASYAGGCCNPLLLQPDVGVVAIGTASANLGYKLHVNGNVLCTTLRSNGFIEPSDARLKVNIKPLEGALSKVMAMQGVTYNWNKELEQNKPLTDKLQYGLIAQELEKIIPELINTDEDGWKGIEYSHLVPVLIEALKEQQQTIETQKQLITGNTDDITFLKNYTKELEAKINTIAADKTSTGNK
ncbi:MAG: tail fiber domain-containing protein, partial [Bacteroidia bacterium]